MATVEELGLEAQLFPYIGCVIRVLNCLPYLVLFRTCEIVGSSRDGDDSSMHLYEGLHVDGNHPVLYL